MVSGQGSFACSSSVLPSLPEAGLLELCVLDSQVVCLHNAWSGVLRKQYHVLQ